MVVVVVVVVKEEEEEEEEEDLGGDDPYKSCEGGVRGGWRERAVLETMSITGGSQARPGDRCCIAVRLWD